MSADIYRTKVIIGTEQNGVLAGKPVIIVKDGVQTPAREISHHEVLCEQDTSYNGHVLDCTRVYETPYGLVERSYWARGAGLERSGTDYRIIPATEIAEAQRLASETAAKAQAAAEELRRLQPAAC